MGRRRNPVLSEYFYRHDKLPDSSNRYEQSCKACGERFPKGRSETLQAHLSKHCRAISPQDRARAIAQLRKAADEGGNYQDASLPTQTGSQKQTAMTALDALAEISSQHLSTRPSAPGARSATPAGQQDRGQQPLSADDFLVSDLKGESGLENGRAASPGADSSLMPFTKSPDPSLMMYRPNTFLNVPNTAGAPLSMASSSPTMTSPVIGAASSDSQGVFSSHGLPIEPEIALTNGGNASLSDQFFHRQRQPWSSQPQQPNLSYSPNMGPSAIDPALQDAGRDSLGPSAPSNQQNAQPFPLRPASHPRPIAAHPSGSTSGSGPSGIEQKAKQRTRQRFTDDRRKEVQKVRKIGACLRCRMLKKVCTSETPCTTCRSIESPRLWNFMCIRVRMKNDFKLFGGGLHQKSAFAATSQVKSQFALGGISGRIEVTNFPDQLKFATFTVLRGTPSNSGAIDPALLGDDKHQISDVIYIIDGESDNVTEKLKIYLEKHETLFFEAESSFFMKPTLMRSHELSTLDTTDDKERVARVLLKRALGLWNLVAVLTSAGPPLQLFVNNAQPASMTPASLTPEEVESMAAQRTSLLPHADGLSCDVITKQILAAIEKRVGSEGSYVMDELERQLLRIPQKGKFELFLVGIVLLGCAERICAYYRGVTNETTPSSSEQDLAQQSRQALGILGEGLDESWHSQNGVTNIDQALVDALGASNAAQEAMDLDASTDPAQGPAQETELSDIKPTSDGVGVVHRQSSHEDASMSQVPDTPAPPPSNHRDPTSVAAQGEKLTEKVNLYFRLRSLIPRMEPHPEDGLFTLVGGNGYDTSDPILLRWINEIQLHPQHIAKGVRLVPGGYGNYVARLFHHE